ncbi:MAG: alpha/beta fold hydrolase [Bacteroidota bacterium]|nr:alpha/beta fold hydrolase [Bacteroidota bacterium]
MPLIKTEYKKPFLFNNGHWQTIIPFLVTNPKPNYTRKRLELPDGDFIDLDFTNANAQNKPLIVILHGLEGSSSSGYIIEIANQMQTLGYESVVFNFRGCSGEINRLFKSYHSGATEDLETVLKFLINMGYNNIHLLGFSLGGNVLLKYLGESGKNFPNQIKSAVAISVPIMLYSSAIKLAQWDTKIYLNRFLKSMKGKIIQKKHIYPDWFDFRRLMKSSDFESFDDAYTAPSFGFESAKDYYQKSSSFYFLNNIWLPTLLINAENDPFLSKDCFPIEIARTSDFFFFEQTISGGHVGFNRNKNDYLIRRIASFYHSTDLKQ